MDMNNIANNLNNINLSGGTSSSISEFITSLGNNKYFIGLVVLLMNVGGRFIELDIAKKHKKYLSTSKLLKRLIIFSIAFLATRDLIVSFTITAAFIVFVMHLFNDESEYCILQKGASELDTNKDGEISAEEIRQAYDKLKKAGMIK